MKKILFRTPLIGIVFFIAAVFFLTNCKSNSSSAPASGSGTTTTTTTTGSTASTDSGQGIVTIAFVEQNTNSNLMLTSFNYSFGDSAQNYNDIQNNVAISAQDVTPAMPSGTFSSQQFIVQVNYPFEGGQTYYFVGTVCAENLQTGANACSSPSAEASYTVP